MINQRPRAAEAAKAPKQRLPHDVNREASQPYAKEAEDYANGVIAPPEENPLRAPPTGRKRGPGASKSPR